MQEASITFRQLLHPISPEEFFAHAYGRLAVHMPGDAQKLAGVFSWQALNRLLNQTTLWSDQTMKLVLDGRDLRPEEFCVPGRTRQGNQAMLPDFRRVKEYLQRGATLVLDIIERLSSEVAAVTTALEAATGSPVVCNAYCSWCSHQGFSSHFDSSDVFVLHIEGEKTWRLYEGRFEHPLEGTEFSYAGLPPHAHERAKGRLLKEVVLSPGDVLYIPRGQYHDAIAHSDASLHLSFGSIPRTGHDFVTLLARSLPADPLFRAALPHFDDAEAYRDHLQKLADRLHALISDSATLEQARAQHRERTFRQGLPDFALPGRAQAPRYRVRWRVARLMPMGEGLRLETPAGARELSAEQEAVARWLLAREYFDAETLERVFPESNVKELTDAFAAAGLIEAP